MAEEKKRRGRRAHLNDFYRDVSGNYIYTGTCYVCTAAPQERTALLRRLWLLAAVMAVSVVTGGCIPAPGMGGSFYLLLPYMAEVGLTGSVVWAMTRWQAREYPMRAYVYKATVKALPGRCMAEAILAGVGAAAEVVYLLLSGTGGHGLMAALYLLLKAVSAAAALFARRLVLQSRWEPAEGNGEITTQS